MVLYACRDLLWTPRIRQAAESAGLAARPLSDASQLGSTYSPGNVQGFILDLDQEETAFAILAHLRAKDAEPAWLATPIVAFGPHVEKEAMDRARRLGVDQVFSRAAFQHKLPALLVDWASRTRAR